MLVVTPGNLLQLDVSIGSNIWMSTSTEGIPFVHIVREGSHSVHSMIVRHTKGKLYC